MFFFFGAFVEEGVARPSTASVSVPAPAAAGRGVLRPHIRKSNSSKFSKTFRLLIQCFFFGAIVEEGVARPSIASVSVPAPAAAMRKSNSSTFRLKTFRLLIQCFF
jgi:hypothetical protein